MSTDAQFTPQPPNPFHALQENMSHAEALAALAAVILAMNCLVDQGRFIEAHDDVQQHCCALMQLFVAQLDTIYCALANAVVDNGTGLETDV